MREKITESTTWLIAVVLTLLALILKLSGGKIFYITALTAVVFWISAAKGKTVNLPSATVNLPFSDDTEKFANDLEYRNKIIAKYEKNAERDHANQISRSRAKRDRLVSQRAREIERLKKADWKMEDGILLNKAAGVLSLNGTSYFFNSIKGAKINCISGQRYEEFVSGNETTEKHLSGKGAAAGGLAGAIAGGFTGGIIGAAIGTAALGGETRQSQSQTKTQTISTCDYLGVSVNMDGFVLEIPVLKEATDQSSEAFRKALNKANAMIVLLKSLALLPVPENYDFNIENRPSILEYDNRIVESENELRYVESLPVQYQLPTKYAAILDREEKNQPTD